MMTTILRGTLVLYAICSLTAMAPMNLSFFLVLASSLIIAIQSKKGFSHLGNSPEFKSYRFWALALLAACWGSLVAAKFFPFAYAGHDPEITFHGFLKIWYLLIPAVLLYAYSAGSDCESFSLATIIKPWWIATIVLLFVAVIQLFTGWPHAQLIPDETSLYHATLFFGHHLSTASVLIFPAFTALAVALGYFTRKDPKQLPLSPKLALITGVAGILILFLSYARTAWIALFIGVILLIKKYFIPRLSRTQWISGTLAGLLTVGLFIQIPIVKNRIEKLYGVSERMELWKANIDFFTHRPLTGIGWLKTQEMSEFYFKSIDPVNYKGYFWGHAHSNLFEMLGGTGLIGLLVFLGWSFFTLRFSHRLAVRFELAQDYFHSDLARGIFIALILLHWNGLTNVTFWEGKVMHQQMLTVGMLLILNQKAPNLRSRL